METFSESDSDENEGVNLEPLDMQQHRYESLNCCDSPFHANFLFDI